MSIFIAASSLSELAGNIGVHDLLAGLMAQLLLRRGAQAVVDHAVEVAGGAAVQRFLRHPAVPVVAADFQLIHPVRSLGEQRLELMGQHPEARLPDIFVHGRRDGADHPAVAVAVAHLGADGLGLGAAPQRVPALGVQVAHHLFILGAVAGHDVAVGVDEEGIEAHITGQQALLAVEVVDEAMVEVGAEPLFGRIAPQQLVDESLKVFRHHGAVVDDVLGLHEVEAVVLTLDREERKMSLGIKQLKQDPWETIEEKYPVGSKHTAKVRNFTNFGVFVEIEEGVDGLIHISDLSWTKKIKHPSEFTQIGAEIEVQVLEIDKENRRLSLGHKQLEENPWDVFETIFTVGSIHEGTIIEVLDKGAVISLPYGVEGFATPKHLVKEDGSQAAVDEKLQFKVIEFNKEAKRIILSHSRIFEDEQKGAKKETGEKKSSSKRGGKKEEESAMVTGPVEKTTLGDIEELAALKEKLAGK